jgi:NAD(P)-dependent dehydrogenase (short-subunit alcohol dehydrogenase family)
MSHPLKDKVVVVTGASSGIGRATARALARCGARLALAARSVDKLRDLERELGECAAAFPTDVTRGAEVVRLMTGARERFGRIDVLLHLVGGWVGGTPVVGLDPDEVRSMLDQHLWTTLHVAQAVVPGMVARGSGRVLAVTSSTVADPARDQASYASAKAAQEMLLRSLAREVAGSGVTVNLVVVRAIDAAHERETAPTSKNAANTTPEEIADVLAFLASPAAAAINGARVPLTGRG